MKLEKLKVENAKARRLNMQFRQQRLIYWQSVKKIRQEKVEPNIDLNKLVEHFTPLLTVKKNNFSENLNNNNECKNRVREEYNRIKGIQGTESISHITIKGILAGLKNNKAIGSMGVSNEMLKYASGESVPRIIAKIMEILINTNTMPIHSILVF